MKPNISRVLVGLVGFCLSATQPTIFRRFRSFAPYNQAIEFTTNLTG
jgi:hypothetical protein